MMTLTFIKFILNFNLNIKTKCS